MEITLGQLARLLEGELEGDQLEKVHALAKIEEAKKGEISFIANPKYEAFAQNTEASALVVSKNFKPLKDTKAALIRVEDPYSAFTLLLEKYGSSGEAAKKGIEEPSYISPQAELAEACYVGAFAYIGKGARIGQNVQVYPHVFIGDDVTVKDGAVIYPGVKIYKGCVIGQNSKIHAGTVIGSDGFGFAPQKDGTFKAIPQTGNVIIGDNVDIGANCVIDRATMGATLIHDGAKLDNLIQIAHNVHIGANTVIAAQAGVSGSSTIGENCMIGGQTGVVGHVSIADDTKIGAQSGVSKSVKKTGLTLQGSPAFDYGQNLKSYVVYKKLPELHKRIEFLEQKVLSLSKNQKID